MLHSYRSESIDTTDPLLLSLTLHCLQSLKIGPSLPGCHRVYQVPIKVNRCSSNHFIVLHIGLNSLLLMTFPINDKFLTIIIIFISFNLILQSQLYHVLNLFIL